LTDSPEPHDSPVFARARNLDPRVASPSSPWALILGVAALAVLALVVFSMLQAGRQARARAAEHAAEQAAETRRAAPTPVVVPAVAPAPVPVSATPPGPPPVLTPPPAAQPPLAPIDPDARQRAPALVVDFSGSSGGAAAAAATPGAAAAANSDKLTDDERFSERIAGSSVETTRASKLSDPSRVAPQGTVIPAVLETAINSDTPGFARAVVSRDVRGFDGSRVLIPRGSKLVGQYKSGVAEGQSRAFVVWSRILTPDGVSIDVDSPAADQQGRGGLTGEVDEHFFRRFGGAILLSVLSGGIDALASRSNNSSTAIVIGSPTQATQLASVALQKQIDIPVTIKVPQGEPIRVFVARDLDFSSVEPARPR
jgi:type IV secretory pathway VirB10-like protein